MVNKNINTLTFKLNIFWLFFELIRANFARGYALSFPLEEQHGVGESQLRQNISISLSILFARICLCLAYRQGPSISISSMYRNHKAIDKIIEARKL